MFTWPTSLFTYLLVIAEQPLQQQARASFAYFTPLLLRSILADGALQQARTAALATASKEQALSLRYAKLQLYLLY